MIRFKFRRTLLGIGAAIVLVGATLASGTPARGQDRESQVPTPEPTRQVRCSVGSVRFNYREWKTNFLRCAVALDEFRTGGTGKDGIPPIDQPRVERVADASAWLTDQDPVIVVEQLGDARAYPLQIMVWHEIVNDWVGGIPVTVTFCVLCHMAIAFDRQPGGQTLDFGSTGSVRHSNLVMWDRQTESWWQQATGEAIVGQLTGTRLRTVPASIVSFGQFRAQRPEGYVLSRETGYPRDYGINPYPRYDSGDRGPYFFDEPIDSRLRAMDRVAAVSIGAEAVAYPFARLRGPGVVSGTIGGEPIVVFFDPRTRSALDQTEMGQSRAVGSATVYARELDGRLLTFAQEESAFVDVETGSAWTVFGQATSGPLTGTRLRPIQHLDTFWFAAAAFHPDIRVWAP